MGSLKQSTSGSLIGFQEISRVSAFDISTQFDDSFVKIKIPLMFALEAIALAKAPPQQHCSILLRLLLLLLPLPQTS